MYRVVVIFCTRRLISDVLRLGANVQMGREGRHLCLKTSPREHFALSHLYTAFYMDIPKNTRYFIFCLFFWLNKGSAKDVG